MHSKVTLRPLPPGLLLGLHSEDLKALLEDPPSRPFHDVQNGEVTREPLGGERVTRSSGK